VPSELPRSRSKPKSEDDPGFIERFRRWLEDE
jgi:hypothetical protein